jgi:hypothetical protein
MTTSASWFGELAAGPTLMGRTHFMITSAYWFGELAAGLTLMGRTHFMITSACWFEELAAGLTLMGRTHFMITLAYWFGELAAGPTTTRFCARRTYTLFISGQFQVCPLLEHRTPWTDADWATKCAW